MTTLQTTCNNSHGSGCIVPLVKLAVIAAFALALFTLPQVVTRPHAEAHSEAEQIRNCGNVIEIWLNSDCTRFHEIKQLDNGQVADQIVQPTKALFPDKVLEITAFVVGAGTLAAAYNMLKAKNCTRVWSKEDDNG